MRKLKMVVLFATLLLSTTSVFAQDQAPSDLSRVGWGVMSAAFVLGIAAAGGAIGQGRAVAAAVEGIARNPGAAGPIRLNLIIGLALIESLVIYALVIAFIAINK